MGPSKWTSTKAATPANMQNKGKKTVWLGWLNLLSGSKRVVDKDIFGKRQTLSTFFRLGFYSKAVHEMRRVIISSNMAVFWKLEFQKCSLSVWSQCPLRQSEVNRKGFLLQLIYISCNRNPFLLTSLCYIKSCFIDRNDFHRQLQMTGW